MKKALLKSISSSPSRTEKFPPPLMRFVRSNTGNKSSRRRSLSSPMFMRKKNPTGTAVNIETTQEPSSPKVTCIGQVRVRRSSKSKNSSTSSKPKRRNSSRTKLDDKQKKKSCWRVREALCCSLFSCIKTYHCTKFSPIFSRNWDLFGCCKKVDDDSRDDGSSRVESIPRNTNHVSDKLGNNENIVTSTTIGEAQVEESSKEVLHSSAPPRNALLLTRCRSAPYRSSSLAGRFWGSPLEGVEDNDDQEKIQVLQELHGGVDNQPDDHEEAAKKRLNNNQIDQEMESSVDDSVQGESGESIQDLRGTVVVGGAAVHPLLLTRSKSEPARTGERLMNPDSNFYKRRRLEDSDEASSQHNCD